MTAEPNTSMTTNQALAMLKKMKYMTPNPAIADAVSVLTQEIERLTDGAEANRVAAAGEIVETTLTSETIIYPRGSLAKFRRACDWRQA